MTDFSEQVRDDAFELFAAEAARVRLEDRTGDVRVVLRSGHILIGELSTSDVVSDHLELLDTRGRQLLVSTNAISVMHGSSAALRDEASGGASRSLASRLRETWSAGGRLRVLLASGEWLGGAIVLVASDHVELAIGGYPCVIPFAAGQAWDVGRAL
ncbi:MAG: hypothetical protein PSX37_11165 [bacterium]|nr:hypothetical protein [bacterium]